MSSVISPVKWASGEGIWGASETRYAVWIVGLTIYAQFWASQSIGFGFEGAEGANVGDI